MVWSKMILLKITGLRTNESYHFQNLPPRLKLAVYFKGFYDGIHNLNKNYTNLRTTFVN